MWWAFWRKGRSEGASDGPTASTPPPPARPAARSAVRPDEPDEERRPTPAFSGAAPEPGRDARALPAHGADDLSGLLSLGSDDPSLDLAGVRADVVALVEAALVRDRGAAAEVLRRREAQDGPGMASIAAMAALGDRCAAAAGFPAEGAGPSAAASAAVVAQGDTTAGRAEPLLRAVAPHASRDLVRLVVRFACGVPDQDPGVAHLADAPPEDLVLVAAVLLAQTVRDGGGDTQVLARELEDLLPG